jgi:pimeloyl-ACP methyl ester carboxylesterase
MDRRSVDPRSDPVASPGFGRWYGRSMLRHHTIDSDGVPLHVVEAGDPDAPVVVLLHGWPEDWRCWQSVLPLLEAEFRLIAPDQRGFGRSGRPEGTGAYALPYLMADLHRILDTLGVEQAGVVGHDVGGALVWAIGAFTPDRFSRGVVLASPHPKRFRAAAIEDPTQIQRSFYVWLLHAGRKGEALLGSNDYRMLADWAFAGSSTPAGLIDSYRADWAEPGAFTAMAEWYRANYRPDLFNPDVPLELPQVALPVLYLHGEQDVAFVPGALTGSGEFVDASFRERLVPDVSHWITHDAPGLVADEIRQWMGQGG